jgi:hypothetical protein
VAGVGFSHTAPSISLWQKDRSIEEQTTATVYLVVMNKSPSASCSRPKLKPRKKRGKNPEKQGPKTNIAVTPSVSDFVQPVILLTPPKSEGCC